MSEETAIAVSSPEKQQLMEVLKQPPQSAKVTRLAAFTPANLTEAIAMAKLMSRSELVPKEYRNKPENVLIGMQYAAELGIPPLLGLQNISIINGRASVWGDLFLGLIQTHPAYEYHKEYFDGEGATLAAVCIMKRKGSEPHLTKFSVQDATTARLWGKEGPWKTNPKRMLQMRARGFCGRDKFSDALKGLIIAEEAMDLPVDTSDAKKARENATLDIGTSVSALSPSAEPNRGHEDTGLQRTPEQSSPREKTMCAECRVVDGHDKTCSQFGKLEQDRRTSSETVKAAYMIMDFEAKTKKKNNEPYLLLSVVAPDPNGGADKHGKLYVWHQSCHEYLKAGKGKTLLCEVSTKKEGDKDFVSLEHILEIGGVPFVNNAPAQQGELKADDDF
jgi:hypothetical protein